MSAIDTQQTVSLPDDEMWQSFVAIRVVRKSLLEFTTVNGEKVEGFITGIDDDWLQITTRHGLNAVLLHISNISKVMETGQKLMSLFESNEYSQDDVRKVEKFSANTRAAAHEFLRGKKDNQDQNE